jgi:hypothetical protein
LCCVFCFASFRLVCLMLPVFLDCPFLSVPSVFSNIYCFCVFVNNLTFPLSIESIHIRYQGRAERFCGSKNRNRHKYIFYSVEKTGVPI